MSCIVGKLLGVELWGCDCDAGVGRYSWIWVASVALGGIVGVCWHRWLSLSTVVSTEEGLLLVGYWDMCSGKYRLSERCYMLLVALQTD